MTGRKFSEMSPSVQRQINDTVRRALRLDNMNDLDDLTDELPKESHGPLAGLNMLDLGMATDLMRANQEHGPNGVKNADIGYEAILESVKRLGERGDDIALEFEGVKTFKELTTPAQITGLRRVAMSPRLWEDLQRTTNVAGLFGMFRQTTNPESAPLELTPKKFKPGTQGTVPAARTLSISPTQYTSDELVDYTPITYQTEMESIIAFVPLARRNIVESYQITIEDLILNADPKSGTDNINNSGAATSKTTAGFEHYFFNTKFRGLRARVLRDTTASNPRSINHAKAIDVSAYSSLLKVLPQRFVARRLVFIQDLSSYLDMVTGADEVLTLDKLGPRATLLTGQLGQIFNVPIVVSDALEQTNASGVVSSTAANNTKSSLLAVDRQAFRNCVRAPLGIQAGQDITKRQLDIVASAIVGFNYRNDDKDGLADVCDAAALAYNIGA